MEEMKLRREWTLGNLNDYLQQSWGETKKSLCYYCDAKYTKESQV